jgi:hypothetical protein
VKRLLVPWGGALLAAPALLFTAGCTTGPATASPAPSVERGRYLVATLGCGDWGISFATNLTPDENTGIGSWSEATFVKSLKTGRHMGVARPVLPPMPWPAYRNLTDDDLRSIYAYLRTIPAVHNRVPEPVGLASRRLRSSPDAQERKIAATSAPSGTSSRGTA